MKFLYEQLILNQDFTTYVLSFLSRANIIYSFSHSSTFKEVVKQCLPNIAQKLVIEILIHGNVTNWQGLKDFSEMMNKLVFSTDPEQCKTFVDPFLANPQQLVNILIRCPERPIRRLIKNLCLNACLGIIESEKSSYLNEKSSEKEIKEEQIVAKSKQFIDLIISFIGNDLALLWPKFREYFELLKDLQLNSTEILTPYLANKDVISTLLDFFLEKQSPFYNPQDKRTEMGNQAANPDFETLMEIVSNIILNSPVENISKKAWECLNSPQLIQKYTHSEGKIETIRKMIIKLMTNNKNYTKQICKLMLNIINEYQVVKFHQYFKLFCDIIDLPDNFQILRFEWLLGIPQPEDNFRETQNYGLAAINTLNDEYITYVSPIGIAKKEYPLLCNLYRNRNRLEYFTTQCIQALFKLAEHNELLYNYLKVIPSPTYQHAKYCDWLLSFLANYSITSQQYYSEQIGKERQNLIADAKNLVELFAERIKSEGKQIEPFMIGSWIEEREIFHQDFPEYNIKVCAYEIATEVYKSIPNGVTNLALTTEYLAQ